MSKVVDTTKPEDIETMELEEQVRDAEMRTQKAKYQFLRDGHITLADCQKLAEKFSERDGVYYSADDILDKWFRDDGVVLEDFIPEDKPPEVSEADRNKIQDRVNYLDELASISTDEEECIRLEKERDELMAKLQGVLNAKA